MLKTKIESLLFVSPKPMAIGSLVSFLKKQGEKTTLEEVMSIIEELKLKYNTPESGLQLIQAADSVQFVSNQEASSMVKQFLKEDLTGELTPASLEALTVIAYRGPITKTELEQIRGVNCSLIIRNLLIRGLVSVAEEKEKMRVVYEPTVEFLKYLGINSVKELPDYERLHQAENLENYLAQAEQTNAS